MTSSIVYKGELRTEATHLYSQSVVETDAPLDNQGMAQRFSPTDLVATALGSCMMTIMGIKARDMQIDLTGTKIEILKHMKSEPRRIGAVDVKFILPAGLQLDDKQRTILQNAALTCPVAKSLDPAIEQNVVFNW
ncbi:putative OsmC-like protein [Lacibacter cauensis]|uniref:Putative OsmC-like protein n=1 Tax=Lacibacter cauensis TaxID=510947 RepID=A0A562SUW9_9BACT|nr:OsmC family protein [Lacibacter cauensis]TWI85109.1 putative OsmC-like protein [Lacibacter cauensis]